MLTNCYAITRTLRSMFYFSWLTWWQVVVVPDVEAVAEKPLVQEDVGDADDGQHDHQVEELAQHEAPEVDPEPALNVLGEILKKRF